MGLIEAVQGLLVHPYNARGVGRCIIRRPSDAVSEICQGHSLGWLVQLDKDVGGECRGMCRGMFWAKLDDEDGDLKTSYDIFWMCRGCAKCRGSDGQS